MRGLKAKRAEALRNLLAKLHQLAGVLDLRQRAAEYAALGNRLALQGSSTFAADLSDEACSSDTASTDSAVRSVDVAASALSSQDLQLLAEDELARIGAACRDLDVATQVVPSGQLKQHALVVELAQTARQKLSGLLRIRCRWLGVTVCFAVCVQEQRKMDADFNSHAEELVEVRGYVAVLPPSCACCAWCLLTRHDHSFGSRWRSRCATSNTSSPATRTR